MNFALHAIKTPDWFQLDSLLEVEAIKSFESSSPQLLALLKIFVLENVDSFKSFVEKNRDFLKANGFFFPFFLIW